MVSVSITKPVDSADKIKILIVEDELIIAEDIKMKLNALGYLVTGIACDADEAEEILSAESADLVMLDIMLRGETSGFHIAELLKNKYHIPFIFLTSYADKNTVEQAKLLKPDGYLLKPFTDNDLFTSIEIALFKSAGNTSAQAEEVATDSNFVLNDSIFIKKDYLLIKVKFEDLKWIKSDGNYLELYCRNNKKHLVRSTLKDFLNKLPKNIFLQTHKSYSINVNYIDAIEYSHVIIEEQKIPIGRLFVDSVKKTLHIEF